MSVLGDCVQELKKQREDEERALQEQLQTTQEQVDDLEARIKKYLANILKVGVLYFCWLSP